MAEDQIRYDILAQEALRGVMRKVLSEVARTGLPGNHHFFITFMTGAPGVRISSRLKEKYPEQMTIVLQYQYWDLKVTDTGFEIGLSFADIPEKLEVPFAAIRGFYDPSVNFELEFDVATEAEETDSAEIPANGEKKETPKAPVARKKSDNNATPAGKPSELPQDKSPAKPDPDTKADKLDADGKPSADVVSLDSFRKNK